MPLSKRLSPYVVAGGGYALYEQSYFRQDGASNPAPRFTHRGTFMFGVERMYRYGAGSERGSKHAISAAGIRVSMRRLSAAVSIMWCLAAVLSYSSAEPVSDQTRDSRPAVRSLPPHRPDAYTLTSRFAGHASTLLFCPDPLESIISLPSYGDEQGTFTEDV